jgi:predicted signal transduction protein with EAL and GGDEF domain
MLSEIMGPSCAATVALKAIAAVSLPFDIEGRSISITTSAGIGIYPTNGEDAVALLESADLALYEAKRAGKNAYRISERTGRPVRTARPVGPRVSSSPPPEATESKRGRDAHD